ncbi:hypothetical protein [Actinacidiphila rubida]|uniref:hypothetical protein n=1 Tax=Actinacidiphila rubida TaxID=310780 RepID=UPI00159F2430|nr:hypothetical protein [Actinacidiphila rubida]
MPRIGGTAWIKGGSIRSHSPSSISHGFRLSNPVAAAHPLVTHPDVHANAT